MQLLWFNFWDGSIYWKVVDHQTKMMWIKFSIYNQQKYNEIKLYKVSILTIKQEI